MKRFLALLAACSPLIASAAQVPSSPTLGDIIRTTWNEVIRPAVIFLFLAATVIFIIGLVQFIANADNEEGRTKGKRAIVWGLVGMAIMFSTGAIMQILDTFFKSF